MKAVWRRTVVPGVWAGLIGFVSVALIPMLVNVLTGRPPLYTAALLGAALFQGASDPASVAFTASNVLGYTAMHLAVFVVFGIIASGLAALAERGMHLWYVGLFFLMFISFHLVAAVQFLAAPMRSVMPEAVIWTAGAAGSIAMGWYLLHTHPLIRRYQPWS